MSMWSGAELRAGAAGAPLPEPRGHFLSVSTSGPHGARRPQPSRQPTSKNSCVGEEQADRDKAKVFFSDCCVLALSVHSL